LPTTKSHTIWPRIKPRPPRLDAGY
jgi:hypothetical protein